MISRTDCVIRAEGHNLYQLISYKEGVSEWTLDSTGIWIWSLLNQEMEFDDLALKITKQFSDLSSNDAKKEIHNLIENGFLVQKNSKQNQPEKSITNKQISNLNVYLTDSILQTPKQSFMLYLLWHTSNTVTVVDDPELADIVFVSTTSERKLFDIDSLYFLVTNKFDEEDLDIFDYIISSKAAFSPNHLKWLRLPVDPFDAQLDIAEQMRSFDLQSGYHIERLSYKLTRYLVGEPLVEKSLVESEATIHEKPFLTIGMATYDDYDGVYFSITSLLLHHRDVFEKCELIILDNNPSGAEASSLMALAENIPNVRYEPYTDKNSTAVRDIIFNLANGEWVVCMDCHVMLPPTTLSQLVEYMKLHPDSKDMLQGPLLNDAGKALGSHFNPEWKSGMYGRWGWDERAENIDGEPFEIQMQGLGIFACRRSAWPGFNALFSGFGGEEGYIHQKFRNQGGKCLCLPFFRWSHRFARPNGVKYDLKWKDRIKNYLIGFEECGLDTEQVETHFTELVNINVVEEAKKEVATLIQSPFHHFDYAVCINLDSSPSKWQAMKSRFETLGIADKVKRFSAISTPEFHHIGCALSHRKIIEHAKKFGYKNVLVFEDDALMLAGSEIYLSLALKELEGKPWKLLYLGGAQHREKIDFDEDCLNLKKVPRLRLTCTHALVYHESVYDEILDALPDNEEGMAEWLVDHYGIDQYLCKIDSRFLVYPKPFTQPALAENEDQPYKYFYK